VLLASGSNVNVRDSKDSTPLHKAAQSGHRDVVTLLLKSSADANAYNTNNTTPLDLASHYGRSDVTRLLAEHMGVGVMDPPVLTDIAHLHTEPQHFLPQVTQPSIGHREDTNGSDERTTLHSASEVGDIETVQALLDSGADVNKQDAIHWTPVFYVLQGGMLAVAKLLIKHGAGVNSQDRTGQAPLHMASQEEHLDIVRLLLNHGTDVNAKMQDHWTALHFASKFGCFEIVKALC